MLRWCAYAERMGACPDALLPHTDCRLSISLSLSLGKEKETEKLIAF